MKRLSASLRPLVRLITALAIVVALTAQYQLAVTRGNFNGVNFFSYFTVESNIAAAFVLLALEFRRDTWLHRLAVRIRPAVTLYMTMTGIVYAVLLAPASADVGLTAKWVDVIVHVLAPLVVLVDWFLAPPTRRPVLRDIPLWLVFPVLYVIYSLIRGPIADWYPYPFLDPNLDGGAAKVAGVIAILVPCVILMAVALVKLTRSPVPVDA